MKFATALALYSLAATGASLAIRDDNQADEAPEALILGNVRNDQYPNREYSDQGEKCSDYILQAEYYVPQECLYTIVCNYPISIPEHECFDYDNEPLGRISRNEFSGLSFACKQQAICGFDQSDDGDVDDNIDYDYNPDYDSDYNGPIY